MVEIKVEMASQNESFGAAIGVHNQLRCDKPVQVPGHKTDICLYIMSPDLLEGFAAEGGNVL